MEKKIMKRIEEWPKMRFSVTDLYKEMIQKLGYDNFEKNGGYETFYKSIKSLEENGLIKAINNKKYNSFIPRLNLNYQKVKKEITVDKDVILEIQTKYSSKIDMTYFLTNVSEYLKEKEKIRAISEFFRKKEQQEISLNERSFELFNDEKFLQNEGVAFLKKMGLQIQDLKCYQTYEPFFYYKKTGSGNQLNVLIVENKDTFYSFKKLLQEGKSNFLNIDIPMVIYGEGKKIEQSIDFLKELEHLIVENIYYFGDLDPVGIGIWDNLNRKVEQEVVPFKGLYEKLLEKNISNAKTIKTNQKFKENHFENFSKYFDEEFKYKLELILKSNKYIPQEGLTKIDLSEM